VSEFDRGHGPLTTHVNTTQVLLSPKNSWSIPWLRGGLEHQHQKHTSMSDDVEYFTNFSQQSPNYMELDYSRMISCNKYTSTSR